MTELYRRAGQRSEYAKAGARQGRTHAGDGAQATHHLYFSRELRLLIVIGRKPVSG